ncbi:hypothetical protein QR680_006215 [Steinernema hermaphroditum]|uniref:Uncharacterized protein n=1 Tax=Steinernema hermaphroditum TaxID=289476 RepID=A0AA39HUP5_9BILA|nr:hypothetical protein QR680_006215 [Steinernema hermaphroditum]
MLMNVNGYLTYPVFFICALTLFLSLFVVPSSLARIYCANIALPGFLSTLIYICATVFQTGLFDDDGPEPHSFPEKIRGFHQFLRAFSQHEYIYFSTLTVILAYIGYAKPFFFQQIMEKRTVTVLFLVGYVWSAITVIFVLPRVFAVHFLEIMRADSNFVPPQMATIAMFLILYFVMLVFYAMTVLKIRTHKVLITSGSSSNLIRKRWNVLISILIYCTPPNIFVGLALAGYICDASIEIQDLWNPDQWPSIEALEKWLATGDNCSNIRVLSQASTNIRLFVTSFTALIAFREYRKSIVRGMAVVWNAALVRILPSSIRSKMHISSPVFIVHSTAISKESLALFLQRLDVSLTYPVFILSATILVLSTQMSPTSLGRTCCANIAVPSFLSTLIYIVARFIDPTAHWTLYIVLRSIYIFLRAFSLQGYLYFSTLTVFLAFIGYAKPFHFQKVIIGWCIMGYLWSTIMTFCAFPKVMIVDMFGVLSYETNFAIPMTFQAVIAVLLYGTMMALYVQTLLKIRATRTIMQRSSWNTLKSVLIYCTPPNIFAALAISGYFCESITEIQSYFNPYNTTGIVDWDNREDSCTTIRMWSQQSTNVRLFITSLTALIAFYEYRRVIRKLLQRLWETFVSMKYVPDYVKNHSLFGDSSTLFNRSNVVVQMP